MTLLAQADLLCSALWDSGRFYTYCLSCDGTWGVFHYSSSDRSYSCEKSGLSMRQVVDYLKGVYHA